MTHPGWALQKAIHAALTGDAALAALVGDRIHDGAPRRAELPFVALEPLIAIDADSDLAEASEHQLTLSIWSRANGKREVLQIAEQVLALLHDADLTLEDHRLVNLRCERQDIRQLADRRTWRGEMRFRAVTEPGA